MDENELMFAQTEVRDEVIIDEDCEVTVIEEATTTDGAVNKSRRSVVWWYFNKLPGERVRGSHCMGMY